MNVLFLDTEFNGFTGQLLSMALVPLDDTLPSFYKELEVHEPLNPWVKENVVPHLVLNPVSRKVFQDALAEYLWQIGPVKIIADWPDDIRHFCESLIVCPGQMLSFMHTMQFELDTWLLYDSEVPHSALHDAIGMRKAYIKTRT